jgi:hypothetical protein
MQEELPEEAARGTKIRLKQTWCLVPFRFHDGEKFQGLVEIQQPTRLGLSAAEESRIRKFRRTHTPFCDRKEIFPEIIFWVHFPVDVKTSTKHM